MGWDTGFCLCVIWTWMVPFDLKVPFFEIEDGPQNIKLDVCTFFLRDDVQFFQ